MSDLKRIHKYALMQDWGHQLLELPVGFRIVACQLQETAEGTFPTIWIECYPEGLRNTYAFAIVATGGEVPPILHHIATLAYDTGVIAHVYGPKPLHS